MTTYIIVLGNTVLGEVEAIDTFDALMKYGLNNDVAHECGLIEIKEEVWKLSTR
jgi:hypothetical protein